MPTNTVVSCLKIPVYVDWLKKHYPDVRDNPEARSRAVGPDDVVVGAWPLYVMRAGSVYAGIEYSKRPSSMLSTVEDMEAHGAHLEYFQVLTEGEVSQLIDLAREQPRLPTHELLRAVRAH